MFLALYILVTIILKKTVFSFETMFSVLLYDILSTLCNTVIVYLTAKYMLQHVVLINNFY